MAYQGAERRTRWIYVTHNSEYYLKERTCLGVRDRTRGSWVVGHQAVNATLSGSILFGPGTVVPNVGQPREGESLCFKREDCEEILTSPVEAIRRPPRESGMRQQA